MPLPRMDNALLRYYVLLRHYRKKGRVTVTQKYSAGSWSPETHLPMSGAQAKQDSQQWLLTTRIYKSYLQKVTPTGWQRSAGVLSLHQTGHTIHMPSKLGVQAAWLPV